MQRFHEVGRRRQRTKQTGFALGAVLIFLILLTIIGMAGLTTVGNEITMAARQEQQMCAFQEAESAPSAAINLHWPLVRAVNTPCTEIRFPRVVADIRAEQQSLSADVEVAGEPATNAQKVRAAELQQELALAQSFACGGHSVIKALPSSTVVRGWALGTNSQFAYYTVEAIGRARENVNVARQQLQVIGPSPGAIGSAMTACPTSLNP